MNLRSSLTRATLAPSLVGLAITAALVVPENAGAADGGELSLASFQTAQPHIVRRPALHPVPLQLPVAGYHLTGRFGDVSGLWNTVHTGLDFAAPSGTPIHAIGAGVVVSTEYDGSYGNKTVLRLEDGTVLWFCHQTEFLVQPGEHVEAGQVIGTIGSTGNTTGPHLHLEVHPHGQDEAIDPFTWLESKGLKP
jgi:murein DD-endopeptidase MepM/ murein hydrolase activator NlpD